MAKPAVIEKEKLEIFKNDTKTLGKLTSEFITNFYPSYGASNETAVQTEQENSLELLNKFVFYEICECTIYNVENRMEYFAKKMQKLFITAYSIKQVVCYGIVSNNGKTSLVIGVDPQSNDATIKTILEGLLPGVKIASYMRGFINATTGEEDNKKEKDRYVGCICGVPSLKIDGQLQNKDLSSLMRSLNGQNYTIMVLCKPVDEYSIQTKIDQAIKIQDECFAISKRTLSIQTGDSEGDTHTDTYNETNGTNKNKGSGINVSGAIPGMLLGAKLGAVAGTPVPGIGNALGAVGGGLIGLVVGQQLNFNRDKSKGETQSISKGYSDAVTKTISDNKSISGDIQNGFALELMKMAESMTERLKVGRSIGMWESVVTYSSDSEIASNIIQGGLYSEIASGIPEILPPVVFSYMDTDKKENFLSNKTHKQQLMIPKGFFEDKDERQSLLSSLVTSEELCGICTIPVDNTVGFEIKESKNYSLNYTFRNNDKELGYVCEYDRPLENMPFGLSDDDLNKHTFVCGITGSGKTNTVKKILESVDKPFMVIEPAKKEYRNIKKENTTVYTLGRPELNCLKLNPFYILPGISPQLHIDLLKDLFSASFAFYGPMPYILEKCIYNIYSKRGWNLTLGFHPYLVDSKSQTNLFEETQMKKYYSMSAHKYVFPTMQDLKDEIDYYIEHEMTYEGDVKGNIRSAIKARIDSLCVGSKGYMFNTHDMVDMEKLLMTNSVLELEGLADDADKAFALGLLIVYVNEYRQVQKEVDSKKGLQHLLVIEEAHRLLKNTSTENNEDLGNPKGKAVEHFTNMLAEMRSYGQGVIVAEQIPSKLAPDVIKNSSNKIVHRIIAKDDQDIIANTIGVQQEDAISLGNCKVGYALCHKEGMVQPVIVKFDEVDSNKTLDKKLYEKDKEEKMLQLNKSIVDNQLSQEVAVWSVKIFVSLMLESKQKDINDGLTVAYEQITNVASLKSITWIPNVDKKKCIMKSIACQILNFMISGMFSNKKLPSDELVQLIDEVVQVPVQPKLEKLRTELTKFYNKESSKKAIEIVAGLCKGEFVAGDDVKNFVNDFCLVKDTEFEKEVLDRLKRGGK